MEWKVESVSQAKKLSGLETEFFFNLNSPSVLISRMRLVKNERIINVVIRLQKFNFNVFFNHVLELYREKYNITRKTCRTEISVTI